MTGASPITSRNAAPARLSSHRSANPGLATGRYRIRPRLRTEHPVTASGDEVTAAITSPSRNRAAVWSWSSLRSS
ncbi:hypothetical protein SBADM41S_10885 [Streptomyces badius]